VRNIFGPAYTPVGLSLSPFLKNLKKFFRANHTEPGGRWNPIPGFQFWGREKYMAIGGAGWGTTVSSWLAVEDVGRSGEGRVWIF